MKKILAIAVNTLKQSLRMKVALIVIFFLLLTIMAMPFMLKSDETQKGQVQLVLAYSLTMASFMLAMLTIFLSTGTLSQEIESKQIHTVVTKPVARWQILLGKWIAIVVLNVVLLGIMSSVTYGVVRYLGRPLAGKERDYLSLQEEVFLARDSVKPVLPEDLDDQIDVEYKRLKKGGEITPEWTESEVKKILRRNATQALFTVPVAATGQWKFTGLPKLPDDEYITIRFKMFASVKTPSGTLPGTWTLGDKDDPSKFSTYLDLAPDTFHEFLAPASAVGEDGTLLVAFTNQNMAFATAFLSFGDGLEVLFRSGSFGANYVRGMVLLVIGLSFMAVIGLVASTFLQFPVAATLVLIIYLCGSATGFLDSALAMPTFMQVTHSHGEEEEAPKTTLPDLATKGVLYAVRFVVPNLERTNPIGALSSGRAVTVGRLLKATGVTLLLQGGIIALCGVWIFSRRQLDITSR